MSQYNEMAKKLVLINRTIYAISAQTGSIRSSSAPIYPSSMEFNVVCSAGFSRHVLSMHG